MVWVKRVEAGWSKNTRLRLTSFSLTGRWRKVIQIWQSKRRDSKQGVLAVCLIKWGILPFPPLFLFSLVGSKFDLDRALECWKLKWEGGGDKQREICSAAAACHIHKTLNCKQCFEHKERAREREREGICHKWEYVGHAMHKYQGLEKQYNHYFTCLVIYAWLVVWSSINQHVMLNKQTNLLLFSSFEFGVRVSNLLHCAIPFLEISSSIGKLFPSMLILKRVKYNR